MGRVVFDPSCPDSRGSWCIEGSVCARVCVGGGGASSCFPLCVTIHRNGMKVPITSSVYGYTKVLAHNLNSKKTSGAAIG